MRILIKVTKDVLRRAAGCGRTQNDNVGSNCAIAVAILRLMPNAWVAREYIYLFDVERPTREYANDHNEIARIKLPVEATMFIDAFDNLTYDNRIAMPELSFEVDVPPAVIEHIGISEIYRVLSESKTLELTKP
jgi:hypothetical protein